ncbi:MAG TPA: pilus assembly protein PilM [Candidatus Dormibacteraeota bacterium]
MSRRLGLDLGNRELRLLEADGRQLTRHAEMLLPDGAVVDGIPTPLLTAVVRGVIQEQRFSPGTVRVAIAETGTAFRDFRLPRLPASELSSAVLFEGRRLIPLDPEDVYFAWQAQRIASGYAVYLVAARRAMIDGVISALGAAGLTVERMDLKPLALARGMGVADGLLLEWGAVEATLVLMAGGRPRFLRTFQLDAPPDDAEAQFEELSLSVAALVKFMRGAAPDISIGPWTPLVVSGRFAFLDGGPERAGQSFGFQARSPQTRLQASADFPWQAHFAEIGLLQQERWQPRLSPSQGGDTGVAA